MGSKKKPNKNPPQNPTKQTKQKLQVLILFNKATVLSSVCLQRSLRMRRSWDVYKVIQYDVLW